MWLRLAASDHTRSSLEQFVRAEQQCCPFFEMRVTESASGLHFQMDGSPEAQWLLDICHQLIDSAVRPWPPEFGPTCRGMATATNRHAGNRTLPSQMEMS
jgi:hypothetical protein